MRTALAAACLIGSAALCAAPVPAPAPGDGVVDIHSYANIDQFATTHIDLILDVDFDSQQLVGSAVLALRRLDPRASQLILDTKGLAVLSVATLTNDIIGATEKPKPIWVSRPFHFGKADPVLGRALIIDLPLEHQANEAVRIEYETAADAPGLQWQAALRPGRKPPPFLYSESEPINARSWLPLQDTPRVRFSYGAHIKSTANVLTVMGGGLDPKLKRSSDYLFLVPEAVPPQGLALVSGDFAFKALSGRVGVYAQHHALSAAAAEFSAAQALLDAGERLIGGARSERLDLVLMPAAFPGTVWTNPHLLFVSPALLSGDQDAAAELAYGIAATWSRQLVAGAEWRDRWIGESIAAYLAGRMQEAVDGERRAAFAALEQWEALRERAADEQILSRDLQEPVAFDIFDRAPALKGRLLFAYLEKHLGRDRLDECLRQFFATYAGKSVTTQQFVDFLTLHLLAGAGGDVTRGQILAWIYDAGIPRDAVLPDGTLWAAVDRARSAWTSGATSAAKLETQAWTAAEWRHFVCAMPAPLGLARMAELDKAWRLTSARNAGVASCWLQLAIRENYRPAFRRVEETLAAGGRPELLAPLYRLLVATPEGALVAKRVYSKARPSYHRAATDLIDPIVNPVAETEVQ